ncbi:hypothetical protein HDU86_002041 [Geranomyces michiganensis]|nr:hypothetical protein HDU86_002041 [Geranomyces michiganensis]
MSEELMRIVRQRSATIGGGIPPFVPFAPPPIAPPVVTSSWDVDEQRDVVEEVVDTVQTPYIIGRAEDIDAVIDTASQQSKNGKGAQKQEKRTRSARSQSVGAGVVAGSRDIDGYMTGSSASGTAVPRMSFAARLGLRFHSYGKAISPGHPAPAPLIASTREVAASHTSFAESFPAKAIVSFHVGLPAPVPAAAADTLPESYFPQTLTTASEDIDVLTSIGIDGAAETRAGGSARVDSMMNEAEEDDEFDVDKIFQLADSSGGDSQGQTGNASGHSKPTRPASADRWRKGKGLSVRAEGTAQSVPSSPMVAGPPRVHQAITASNTDKMTDIDDVLASDPDPYGLEGNPLPRMIVDAGDFLPVESGATKSYPLKLRTSSVPLLSSTDKNLDAKFTKGSMCKSGTLSNSAEGMLGQSQQARPASRFEWTTPQHQEPPITRDDQLRYFRDDTRAAEDILAFVDMGATISPAAQGARPIKSRRGRALDIQTLVLAGEGNDAGSDSDTSIVPESPGDISAGEETVPQRRASSAGKKRGVPLRRISYIEIDKYSVVDEHPTSPTVAVPTTTYAGSLDIDQLFAGESPSGWANRHAFPPGKHHAIERGDANIASARDIVAGALDGAPSEVFTITRAAPRRRSVSLGAANLDGTTVPPAKTTAPVPRRLTCLDISHFMGIAETVEADYEGLPIGAGTKRVSVTDVAANSSDIIHYMSLGTLPTAGDGDEQRAADITAGPDRALGPGMYVLGRQRRGSSMGQLNIDNKWSRGPSRRHDRQVPSNSRDLLDYSGGGGAALAVRLRRSLDELATSHHFPKHGSFREMFINNPHGWQPPPAVASSIVGVRPPKIDIDELVGSFHSCCITCTAPISYSFGKNSFIGE